VKGEIGKFKKYAAVCYANISSVIQCTSSQSYVNFSIIKDKYALYKIFVPRKFV
jgi:hypothetical protein